MIPMVAEFRVEHPKGSFRIWAPLILAWVLLAPVAVALSPFACVACALRGRDPIQTFAAVLGVIAGLSGLVVEVDSPAARVLIRVQ